jgi:hypothetical protein
MIFAQLLGQRPGEVDVEALLLLGLRVDVAERRA